MAYRQGNFSLVIDSNFQPFSFQEMIAPLVMYKDAYEKTEDAYNELADKSDKFKYLSESLPEGSKARQLYEGYANELDKQAKDLANNGLSMGNRRALTGLKRRYQGEIGRLNKADEALQKEKELRRQVAAKDPTMLYALDNLSIDDYLDNATPNTYSISGNALYTKAAAAGKAASSRVYSAGDAGSTLGGYYRDYVKRMGYTPDQLRQFGDQIMQDFTAQVSVLPELQQAANQILEANGVNQNLTGNNLRMAQQQVIRGLIDGSVYSEDHNPVRDAGVMSATEKDASARAWAADTRAKRQLELSALQSGYKWNGNNWEFDAETLKERQEALGIPQYNPEEWEMDPNGKPRRKARPTTSLTQEEKDDQKKGAALLKLSKSDLAHNDGFDVTFGTDRHHYNYIGAISRHGDTWYHGALGEDNPGHNWLRGWGFGSTSNVENAWGTFSAEGSDSKDMRVLSPDEMITLLQKDESILTAIEERCVASGIDPTTADIQLIEVPNEKGGGGGKGYLIAVH